jgi:hypothetical protein
VRIGEEKVMMEVPRRGSTVATGSRSVTRTSIPRDLAEEIECSQWTLGFLANETVEPISHGRGHLGWDLGDRMLPVGRQKPDGLGTECFHGLLAGGQNTSKDQDPELCVGDYCGRWDLGEQRFQAGRSEPVGTPGRLGRRTECEKELGNDRCSRRPPELAGEGVRARPEIEVTVGCEFCFRSLEETDVNLRQNLGGCCCRRLASAGAAQDPTLNAIIAGEHGQYQMTVAEWGVVEHQCFVFDDRHEDMVSETEVLSLEFRVES